MDKFTGFHDSISALHHFFLTEITLGPLEVRIYFRFTPGSKTFLSRVIHVLPAEPKKCRTVEALSAGSGLGSLSFDDHRPGLDHSPLPLRALNKIHW